jgi:hypothetical protein
LVPRFGDPNLDLTVGRRQSRAILLGRDPQAAAALAPRWKRYHLLLGRASVEHDTALWHLTRMCSDLEKSIPSMSVR